MQRRRAGLVLALLLALPPQAKAQQAPASTPPQPEALAQTAIVTLDQERLFLGTAYGRALQAKFDKLSAALLAENRKIDAELESEERSLTDQRATMTAEAFRPLAEAFDAKANGLRKAQEAKSTNLAKSRDVDRQTFFQAVAPILGDYMVERGAVAILDKSAIVVSLGSIDITTEVIARIDSRLGDGSTAPAAP